jgi:hypothetical protein
MPALPRHPRSRKSAVTPPPVLHGVHAKGTFHKNAGTYPAVDVDSDYVDLPLQSPGIYSGPVHQAAGDDLFFRVFLNTLDGSLTLTVFGTAAQGFPPYAVADTLAWANQPVFNTGPLTLTWIADSGSGTVTVDINLL